MAQTTFSGPVKAGPIFNTTGTTVGTNVANVGFAVMGQSAVIDIIGATANDQVIATIPAGSQIIDVILNVTTANNEAGTATVSVGTASSATAFIPATNVKVTGTTRGTLSTSVATDVGTTDIQVLADFTAAGSASTTGAATVTVLYLQARDLL